MKAFLWLLVVAAALVVFGLWVYALLLAAFVGVLVHGASKCRR